MKLLLKLLAPFLLGLFRKFGPTIPGINHAQLERNRRRLVSALAVAFVSVLLLAAGLLTMIIDAAVQFEQRGAVEFNVVMMSAVGLLAAALVAGVIARVKFPSLADFTAVARRAQAAPEASKVAKQSRPTPPRRPEYAH